MKNRKLSNTHFDPKQYYIIFLELGIIGSLLIFIVAMNIPIQQSESNNLSLVTKQEVIKMEDVVKTKQAKRPPAPPRPQVPVSVPNNAVVEEEIPDINAEFKFNDPLEIPTPPKQIEVKKEDEEDFFVAVEEMPVLIGSLGDLQKKLKYPLTARQAGIEGRVIVQFIINEKGNVDNPRIMRGIGGGCDEEALRVVKLAKFKPGRQRGVPVRVRFSLPFIFILKD
ncbi:MAG: energy transducer TonB [Balneolaceae bacterium]|jgi:protein TonB